MQTEQQLLRSFSGGDDTAIEILVSRYEDGLYNLCFKLSGSRHEAEDLYQQTWLKVLEKAASAPPRSFRNWLYTVCLNTYRDAYRKNARHGRIVVHGADDALNDSADPAGSAESEAMEGFTQSALMNRIGRLPDKLRLPILLHYFEDLDYNATARVLRVPVGTVKSRLNTAKSRLRKEMESEPDEGYGL